MKSNSKKWQAFTQILMVIGIALAINIIAGLYIKRVDLTADKRYTLSEPTKKLLKNLKDVVFVKVYLEGDDLPSGFRKLSESTREMLDEFRFLAGDKIQYQFINPDDLDETSRKNLYQQLYSKGLQPATVSENSGDKLTERLVIPGAIVTYNNKDLGVELLQQQPGDVPQDQVLHNSTIGLEYQLANAIHKLQMIEQPKIGIIQGHGELKPIELADIYNTLGKFYRVDFVNLPEYKVGRLDDYAAIIIAKPDSTFTDLEKYKIDQYVMGGGKVLWFVESLNANMDSMLTRRDAFTYDYKLNLLEDFLFKYGVRINYDLVQDLNCEDIPIVVPSGNSQQATLLKWPYYPLVEPHSTHPIVNNLGAIWFRFASTLDTINNRQNPDIRKTILLQTSPYTKVEMNPVHLDLSLAGRLRREAPTYQAGPKNLAVLLEGTFNSVFMNRQPTKETLATGQYGQFKERSKPTKMIVVSDGDVIRNDVNKSQQQPYPLGYDHFVRQTFSNKTFVLNCVDYLVDESNLIAVRSKDIRYRPLDDGKVKDDRFFYQMLNMGGPVIMLLVFGLVFNYVRKRRFAR
jgi:ABC-2 type transport system permease protein